MVVPAGPATRRTVLKASLAGLSGLTMMGAAGCGGTHHLKVAPVVAPQDVDLLNTALAVEEKSIAAYTAAAPQLDRFGQEMCAQFLTQELQHAGILRKLVNQLGGQPHHSVTYDFRGVHGRSEILDLLHSLERKQMTAYLAAIPHLSTAYLRQTMAAILANDAQHVTVLRAQQGIVRPPGPFLTVAE